MRLHGARPQNLALPCMRAAGGKQAACFLCPQTTHPLAAPLSPLAPPARAACARRRLDMLPGLLSEHLCSLRQGQERLAVSVIWTLLQAQPAGGAVQAGGGPQTGGSSSGDGGAGFNVEGVWFGRTVIRSRHQLHYQQAQVRARPPAQPQPTRHRGSSSNVGSLWGETKSRFYLRRTLRTGGPPPPGTPCPPLTAAPCSRHWTCSCA